MKLRNLSDGPPGGWRFKHLDTGYVSTGVTFQSLVQKVVQYRQNHGVPVVSEGYARLSDEIEADICASMGPRDQVAYCDTKFRPLTGIHWREVARFLHTLAAWVKAGFEKVPQEEAERRASICATCPLNVGLAGCAVCRTALKAGRDVLMQASTAQDSRLQACGVCGCDLKTSVHVPLSVLLSDREGLVYPDWCWKKRGEEFEAAA
jgi:hypothetical protein